MSKKKKTNRRVSDVVETPAINESGGREKSFGPSKPVRSTRLNIRRLPVYVRSHWIVFAAAALVLMLGLGAMAKNGWLPNTDPLSGKKTGWFGSELPKNASSSWNPFAAPLPSPTPQLSKEYIYAGSRLLAVEDANANAAPPADLAVWRPSNGYWYVLGGTGSAQTYFPWGTNGDQTVQGDFDGDGKTDFSVWRPSTGYWYIMNSSSGDSSYTSYQFGTSCTTWPTGCDLPVPADYDGDGKTDMAVWRPSTYVWYILRSSDSAWATPSYGTSGDIPAPADYDGDGKADVTVWRNSNTTFYTLRSTDSATQYTAFGNNGDKPVPADYDGDGKANYAVRHNAGWIIQNAAMTSTSTTTPSGDSSSDTPVPNDYDGDGKTDIAVWRDSNGDWYIRKSATSGSLRQEHWGTSGDIPVPAYYRR